MNFLVSASNPKIIWEVQAQNKIVRLKFPEHRQTYINDLGVDLFLPLPWELVEQVLIDVFLIYLRTYNFNLLAKLMTLNKRVSTLLYHIIDYRPCDDVAKCIRISRIIRMLSVIHNDYVDVLNIDRYPAIVFRHCSSFGSMLDSESINVWDFRENSLIINVPRLRHTNVYQVRVGDFNGDTVWLNGTMDEGIIKNSSIFFPVINIVFTDCDDLIIHGFEDRLAGLKRLLRLVYGNDTLVNFASNLVGSRIDLNFFR
jgi:hypothetical protein